MRFVLVAVIGACGCYSSFAGYADEQDGDADSAREVDVEGDVGTDEGDVGIDVDVDVSEDGDSDDVGADADDGAEAVDDTDADGGAEDEADVAGEVEADADVDVVDGDLVPCEGGRYDPTSGLCWEDPPSDERRSWQEAMDYCAALSLGGHSAGEWHLPSLDELRSLIRGCAGAETGGSCGVTASCLGWWGCWTSGCNGCYPPLDGPGTGGCYWPDGVRGECSNYWSSSLFGGSGPGAWCPYFDDASVYYCEEVNPYLVRCVRPGP